MKKSGVRKAVERINCVIIVAFSLPIKIFDFFISALLKVYKFADVEETGKVDVATIITLAVQLMGPNFSEAEKESVCKKAEARAEKGTY